MTLSQYDSAKSGIYDKLEYLSGSIGYRENDDLLEVAKVNTYDWLSTAAMGEEIVHRYNIHEQLVAALEDLLHARKTGMGKSAVKLRYDLAEAALAAAKEKVTG